jgi:hypothetical protein
LLNNKEPILEVKAKIRSQKTHSKDEKCFQQRLKVSPVLDIIFAAREHARSRGVVHLFVVGF